MPACPFRRAVRSARFREADKQIRDRRLLKSNTNIEAAMDAITPTLYDTARRALAEAREIDEVKSIRDKALAMKVYAEQAKDRQLINHAIEIQLRAERRAGEMLREMEKNKGGAEKGVGRRGVNNAVAPNDRIPPAKLSDLGITKTQSSNWQRLGALSEEDFEQKIAETLEATNSATAKVIKSITVPKRETAANKEIEFTIPEWNKLSAVEREKYLDPEKFPSDAKLNVHDGDGTDYAQRSYSTIAGCRHPCQCYCWAHDETLRFPKIYPHGFNNPVFRPRMLSAPSNTLVPAEAAVDGRFKNVSSNFMSDMFGAWVLADWIEATLAVERANPQWNFLHLTKFPGRLLEFDFSPNMWIGTSVDRQQRVENVERVFAQLREKYPSLILWLSIEPFLERLKFQRLKLFNFIAIGGAARSMRTPEFRPPHRWIHEFLAQAYAEGCSVFEKTNLYGNRTLELPFGAPIKHDHEQVAPDVFNYLGKNRGGTE
jgi:hypothetical protein